MSEDAKRIGAGALVVKDDRKSSSAASPPSAGKKVIIKSADMKDDMQMEAVNIAIGAFEKHGVEKDVAEHIKKEFDKKYGPTWHCIVGKNFGLGRDQPGVGPFLWSVEGGLAPTSVYDNYGD